MNSINRRELLKWGAACGLGSLMDEAGDAQPASAEETPAAIPAQATSPVQTRMFWTWDHSTEWALNRPGAHTVGSCNEYGRSK